MPISPEPEIPEATVQLLSENNVNFTGPVGAIDVVLSKVAVSPTDAPEAIRALAGSATVVIDGLAFATENGSQPPVAAA